MKQTSLQAMLHNMQSYDYPISEEDFLSLTPKEARQLYRLARRVYHRYAKAKKTYGELASAILNIGQLRKKK